MNVGIIGYGKMGRLRHDIINQMDGHKVIHVCDTNRVIGEFQYSVYPGEVFSNSKVQVVFVCTPNYLTKDLVVGGLDAGKHVFAEKPPGISSAQVLEMIAAENAQISPGTLIRQKENPRVYLKPYRFQEK